MHHPACSDSCPFGCFAGASVQAGIWIVGVWQLGGDRSPPLRVRALAGFVHCYPSLSALTIPASSAESFSNCVPWCTAPLPIYDAPPRFSHRAEPYAPLVSPATSVIETSGKSVRSVDASGKRHLNTIGGASLRHPWLDSRTNLVTAFEVERCEHKLQRFRSRIRYLLKSVTKVSINHRIILPSPEHTPSGLALGGRRISSAYTD